MKHRLVTSFIVLCITFVNVFAVGNFIERQKSTHHEFCALFEHNHHHMHHGIEHTHGHSHKINLIDFHAVFTHNLLISQIDYERPLYLKQWLTKPHIREPFRPPIN